MDELTKTELAELRQLFDLVMKSWLEGRERLQEILKELKEPPVEPK